MKEKWQNFCIKAKEKEDKAVAWLKKVFTPIEWHVLFVVVTIMALLLRYFMFESKSGDYNSFLVHWFNTIKDEGIVKSLGRKIGDYTPAYFYILTLLTFIPVDSLYTIKAVSCIFDVVLAAFVYLSVKEYVKSRNVAFVTFCIVLFLPTVFFNSGSWAQCDSIYASFCVMSLYFLLKKKNVTAVILYGVAFSFKLQAIFLAPVFAVLFFKRKIPLWSPLAVFGVYFLFCVPSWLCGRSLWDLLTIYVSQSQEYPALTLNAPTLPALFGKVSEYHRQKLANVCVCLALAVTGLVIYFAARQSEWKKQSFFDFGVLFALTIPYLLPHMHERYFYLADILSLAYVFLHPKRVYTALLTEFCSFWVVCNYLFGMNYFSLQFLAVVQAVNIILLVKDLWKDYGRKQENALALGKQGE